METPRKQIFTAKTAAGLEELLAGELASLGAGEITILKRAVSFEGDKELLYQANYCCATALRILVPVKSFMIRKQDDLYEEAGNIPWEDYLDSDKTLAVDAVNSSSVFTNTQYIAQKTKDAIVDRFRKNGKQRPSVDLDNPDIRINIHIYKENCNVSIDSSGNSLHKRGYRKSAGYAPLSEVLAAGLVRLSGWDASKPLHDPMCGSGTILIEAAMMANRIPSGFFRRDFGFMKWQDFDEALWKKVKSRADASIIKNSGLNIRGSDISGKAIQSAMENLRFTGLDDRIPLKTAAFGEDTEVTGGFLIFNPPYDERMKVDDIIEFYREIGNTLKRKYKGNEAWIISSDLKALKFIGLHPSKKITVFNGPLECRFVRFNLY